MLHEINRGKNLKLINTNLQRLFLNIFIFFRIFFIFLLDIFPDTCVPT